MEDERHPYLVDTMQTGNNLELSLWHNYYDCGEPAYIHFEIRFAKSTMYNFNHRESELLNLWTDFVGDIKIYNEVNSNYV